MTGARNVKGLVLLSSGLAAGLGMSLYAFQPVVPVPASLMRYDDLPRRLLRLAHIAGVMLPLINVVVGPWLDRVRLPARAREAASWFLLLGAITLPYALALEAAVPTLIALHLTALLRRRVLPRAVHRERGGVPYELHHGGASCRFRPTWDRRSLPSSPLA